MFSRTPSIAVGLAPEGAAVRIASGKTSEARERASVPSGERDWRPAVAALAELLAETPGRRARLAVALAHPLTRFLSVPWSDELMERASAQRYLQAQFAAVFGEAAQAWRFGAEDAPHGRPRLACAVECELLDVLQEVARARGARVESVAPWLVPAFNRARRQFPAEGWFAAVEPGRLALVEVRAGGARHVALSSSGDDPEQAIERSLRRALLRGGGAPGAPVHVASLHLAEVHSDGRTWLAALAETAA